LTSQINLYYLGLIKNALKPWLCDAIGIKEIDEDVRDHDLAIFFITEQEFYEAVGD
jgi:hypothetical protein